MRNVTARKEAFCTGSIHYKGLPCSCGHDGTRYTKSRQCVACVKIKNRAESPRRVRDRSKFMRIPKWGDDAYDARLDRLAAMLKIPQSRVVHLALNRLMMIA